MTTCGSSLNLHTLPCAHSGQPSDLATLRSLCNSGWKGPPLGQLGHTCSLLSLLSLCLSPTAGGGSSISRPPGAHVPEPIFRGNCWAQYLLPPGRCLDYISGVTLLPQRPQPSTYSHMDSPVQPSLSLQTITCLDSGRSLRRHYVHTRSTPAFPNSAEKGYNSFPLSWKIHFPQLQFPAV